MDFNYMLGAIPSPADPRDWRLARIAKVTSEHEQEYKSPWMPPVYNQGRVGSCVAHAIRTLLEAQEHKENGTYTQLSDGFIYANRDIEARHWNGEGLVPAQALSMIKNDGVCLKALYPSNVDYKIGKDNLTPEMFDNAPPYAIEGYARIYDTDEAMSAIKELCGIIIMIPVYNNFRTTKGIVNPTIEAMTNKTVGYHEVVVYGWKHIDGVLYWLVRNSWKDTWGNNGDCYLHSSYSPVSERWAITNKPTVNQQFCYLWKLGETSISNTVNDDIIESDVPLQTINGRTLAPVRILAELLDNIVGWDNSSKTLIICKPYN